MQRNVVTINGEAFFIRPGRDMQVLQAQIVSAAKSGGELIDVSFATDKTKCVLVTPSSAVKFEQSDVEDQILVHPTAELWIDDYVA